MKRAKRGYILVEVMISGAILLWAIAGIYLGLDAANAQLGVSLKEQQCDVLAQQKVEQLSQASTATWVSLAGTTVTDTDVGGLQGWTRTTVFSAVTTGDIASPAAPPTPVIAATITVTTPGGLSVTRVAQKWKAY